MSAFPNPANRKSPRASSLSLPGGKRAFMVWAGSVVLAVCFVPLAWCVANPPAVTRHDLSVRLDPKSNSLAAVDTMEVRTGGKSYLAFALFGSATVEKVSAQGKRLGFTFEGGTLQVASSRSPRGSRTFPDRLVPCLLPGPRSRRPREHRRPKLRSPGCDRREGYVPQRLGRVVPPDPREQTDVPGACRGAGGI